MNRGQRRALWQARFRRENAALGRDPQTVIAGQMGARTKAPRTAASTHLRINDLVFRGFDNSAAWRIASAFEHELTTLLQTHPLPASWRGHITHGHANGLRLNSLADTRGIGEQLARAVFALRADGHRGEAKR
jgi:hypothetical protein